MAIGRYWNKRVWLTRPFTENDEIKVWNIVADEVEVDDDERSQDETADDMTD